MKMKNLFIFIVVCCFTAVAWASSGDDIAKNINKLIRSAEKHYFSKKIQEADASLMEAQKELEELRALDSTHKSLKSLQSKYDRMRKQLDKKLAQDKGKSSIVSAVSTGSSGVKALSHGGKSNLKKAGKELDFALKELEKGEASLVGGDFNMVESYIYNMESKLEAAMRLLDKAQNNNKVDPAHPEAAPVFKRYGEIKKEIELFKDKAFGQQTATANAAEKMKADAKKLNEKWLPGINQFLDPSSNKRFQYPGSHDKAALSEQDKRFAEAETMLAQVTKNVPISAMTPELKQAADKLSFAIEVYKNERNADFSNRTGMIEANLDQWAKRFEQNKAWNENSTTSLFIIRENNLAHKRKEIENLAKIAPDKAALLADRLAGLENENKIWVEKREKWESRPRPFPAAKMSNGKLEGEIGSLLKERNISFKKLAILDKEWWVMAGEYRYMTAAFLSKDKDGDFWSYIRFKQDKTLTGYAPTEIWEVEEQKIRLP